MFLGLETNSDVDPIIRQEVKSKINNIIQSGVNDGAKILIDERNINVLDNAKG